ncbi:MAG: hypothetical protein JWM21_4274 [Acidobacteria bacterium]|nr:hypothetical protein [Acidobacteriota bacterium]
MPRLRFDNCRLWRVKSLALPMKEIENSLSDNPVLTADDALERRIFRVMIVSVILAVGVAALVGPWRVTTGFLLGGLLSLLNYRWMSTSIAALIAARVSGKAASANGSRYIIRYFVVAAAVIGAYKLNLVSLPATIFGLCSFVIALFAEALREFYFIVIHREGIN